MSDSHSTEVFSSADLRRFASEICADDTEIFSELVGDCQQDIDLQLSKLQEARQTQSWKDFSRAAHSIKSAARTFGSPLVKKLSLEIETGSANGVAESNISAIDQKTEDLVKACAEFKAKLQEIKKDAAAFLT